MGITNTSLPSDLYMAFKLEPLMAVWKHDKVPRSRLKWTDLFAILYLMHQKSDVESEKSV